MGWFRLDTARNLSWPSGEQQLKQKMNIATATPTMKVFLSHTHTHHTLAHAPPQTGENPHKHTRQRTVNVFKCMAKQNGSTSCTLKKINQIITKLYLKLHNYSQTQILILKDLRLQNYKKINFKGTFHILIIFKISFLCWNKN